MVGRRGHGVGDRIFGLLASNRFVAPATDGARIPFRRALRLGPIRRSALTAPQSPRRSRLKMLSSKRRGFQGLRLRPGPCRADPLSYMRLTVAISRAFDRLGVWIGAPSGPSQPAAKRRI